MALELIAALVAALGAAGLVMVARRFSKGRLPGWAVPVAAGAAIFAVTIVLELTWAARTERNLPPGTIVVDHGTQRAWWQPWSYVWPHVVRLMALDSDTIRQNPAAPDMRLVELYLFARWQPVRHIPQLIRCTAPIAARADVSPSGLDNPEAADWRPMPADSALIRHSCAANGIRDG